MQRSRGRVVANVLGGLALAMALAGALLVATQHNLDPAPPRSAGPGSSMESLLANDWFMLSRAISAALFAVAGWYLATRRPGVVFGPLALAAGLGNGLAVLGGELAIFSTLGGHRLPGLSVLLWVGGWGLSIEPFVLATTYVLFPDGASPSGRIGRWAGSLSIALCGAGLLHSLVSPLEVAPEGPFAHAHNPLGFTLLPGLSDAALIFPGLLIGAAVLLLRWLRANGEDKRVLGPLAVATVLSLLPIPISSGAAPDLAGEVFVLLTLVAVVAGVLRHRVYGIEVVLNRTLVYAVLTVLVATVYATLVGIVNLLGSDVSGGAGVVPAVGAAFALFPARQRVQRLVNRFLYGQRDEPYAVVSGIGARLEGAGSADDLVPELLAAIVESLRLPYAAIELRYDDGTVRRIESGEATQETDRFPLLHQGRTLGDLVVGRRAGQAGVPEVERVLLADISRQAAVAVSNVMLTEDLRRSRERIINAAEDERRRLRRDLHDGLGPVLTAAATRVDAARNLIERDTASADGLLGDVRGDLTAALDDLRRLVYALRPPALDELGLVRALREHVRRASVPVVFRAPESLPDLPPAVEIAAYRIVAEALNNVSRHSGASSCTVLIACDGMLTIDVCDDGAAANAWTPGVGLSSMRERTVLLGGQWSAGPAADGGGRVHVELPVMRR